MRVFYMKNNRE